MNAVVQNFRTGELQVAQVPPPHERSGYVSVANVASLISAGTEKAVIELARMSPWKKAKARPDLVKKVLAKAGQEGLLATAQIVMNLVSSPLPLGYSCAGVVQRAAGPFKPGDRVACAGLGCANHAEIVSVPFNLTAKLPDEVTFEQAAFVTVGAIALHGVRQAELTLGETVVVMGLGLVGQLTVQLCLAAGCRVVGLDPDPSRVALAREIGAEAGCSPDDKNAVDLVREHSRRRGADAVLITAATSSSGPITLAAELARDRARVVAVGDIGLNVPRRAFFEKEIDLRLSRSYGPGRYDPAYEEKGQDYPVGYVRWTENRNMEAFLDLLAQGKIRLDSLITHRFPIERAGEAYDMLTGKCPEPHIGIVLQYDETREQPVVVARERKMARHAIKSTDVIRFGIVGAGQFGQGVLLPRLRKLPNVEIVGVATGNGLTARTVADRYDADFCTSDYREIVKRNDIHAVLIATRHDLHARMTIAALEAGKHVFVEKPLALNESELASVVAAYASARDRGEGAAPTVLVGFNRRFSPLSQKLKRHFSQRPLMMNYRVNAGSIPRDNWVHDVEVGGGRIVGEVCHFIDLMQYLTDADPIEVSAHAAGAMAGAGNSDNVSITLRFADGSIGTILYTSLGDAGYPKERLDVFGGGRAASIDNWRKLELWNGKRTVDRRLLAAAKGHAEELAAFVAEIRGGQAPIPFASMVLTTQATFAVRESLVTGRPVALSPHDSAAHEPCNFPRAECA